MSSIGERFIQLRGGLPQADFANSIGINVNTLRAYEKDRNSPTAETILAISENIGVNPSWLLTGEGPMRRGEGQAAGPQLAIGQACDPDLVMVPKVRARLSAGNGSLETNGEVKARYAFRREWIAGKGQPGKMVLMDVTGDSMEPAILERDVVLIDQSQADIIPGAIYAVGIDDAVLIKYVDKEPGNLILRSANKEYRPIEIGLKDESQNVRIIGRVVWWCREAR